jgi:hypothetical protein
MPFPLPIDPEFRNEVVSMWLEDVEDRIAIGELEDAEVSWKIANAIYLSLPPGQGSLETEARLFGQRVKLTNSLNQKHEDN